MVGAGSASAIAQVQRESDVPLFVGGSGQVEQEAPSDGGRVELGLAERGVVREAIAERPMFGDGDRPGSRRRAQRKRGQHGQSDCE